MLLNEIQRFRLPSKVYHVTEASNIPDIKSEGLNPHTGKRGVTYKDGRIYVFTSLHEDVLEEVKGLVLFGGSPYTDDEENDAWMASRADIPLALLEIDTEEVADFDRDMHREDPKWVRRWAPDPGMTRGYGLWTNLPIPIEAITIRKL